MERFVIQSLSRCFLTEIQIAAEEDREEKKEGGEC